MAGAGQLRGPSSLLLTQLPVGCFRIPPLAGGCFLLSAWQNKGQNGGGGGTEATL